MGGREAQLLYFSFCIPLFRGRGDAVPKTGAAFLWAVKPLPGFGLRASSPKAQPNTVRKPAGGSWIPDD